MYFSIIIFLSCFKIPCKYKRFRNFWNMFRCPRLFALNYIWYEHSDHMKIIRTFSYLESRSDYLFYLSISILIAWSKNSPRHTNRCVGGFLIAIKDYYRSTIPYIYRRLIPSKIDRNTLTVNRFYDILSTIKRQKTTKRVTHEKNSLILTLFFSALGNGSLYPDTAKDLRGAEGFL